MTAWVGPYKHAVRFADGSYLWSKWSPGGPLQVAQLFNSLKFAQDEAAASNRLYPERKAVPVLVGLTPCDL